VHPTTLVGTLDHNLQFTICDVEYCIAKVFFFLEEKLFVCRLCCDLRFALVVPH